MDEYRLQDDHEEPHWVPSHQNVRIAPEEPDLRNVVGLPLVNDQEIVWNDDEHRQELRRQQLKLMERQYQLEHKIRISVDPPKFNFENATGKDEQHTCCMKKQEQLSQEYVMYPPVLRKHSRSGILENDYWEQKRKKTSTYQETREDSFDVAKTRLYWQQRERSVSSPTTQQEYRPRSRNKELDEGDLFVEISEENGNIRTDSKPFTHPKEDNIIVLKLNEANSLVLASGEPVVLKKVPPTVATNIRSPSKFEMTDLSEVQVHEPQSSINHDFSLEEDNEVLHYERNWSPRPKKHIWDSDLEEDKNVVNNNNNNQKGGIREENIKLLRGETPDFLPDEQKTSSVLKFQSLGLKKDRKYSPIQSLSKFETVESRIPRIKKCLETSQKYKHEKLREDYVASQKLKIFTKKEKTSSISLDKEKIKELVNMRWPGKCNSLSTDTTKSRTNFFGNSGSYTLRCNLNPIAQTSSLMFNKKKFYLTPKPNQLNYFKKCKPGSQPYETFAAQKREFKRYKLTSNLIEDGKILDSFQGNTNLCSETVMW